MTNSLNDMPTDSDTEITTMGKTNDITIPQIHMFPDGRLGTKDSALYLGLSIKTLATMRSQGKGPKFTFRGRIFYFREDLDEWIRAGGRFESTAQARFHQKKGKESKKKKQQPKEVEKQRHV